MKMPTETNAITKHPKTEAVEREPGDSWPALTVGEALTLVGVGAPSLARALLSAVSPNEAATVAAEEASSV